MVNFDAIPSNIRTNFVAVEFDPTQARQGIALKPLKTLLIGGRTSAGSVAELTPKRVTSADDVAAQCGVGSTLHNMAQRYFANGGNQVETWFVSVDDDGSGVACVKTITLGGAQTEAGTLYLYIGGRRIRVPVGSDSAVDTLTVLGARVRDAINLVTDLPFTATASAGVVTLTAKNDGTTANDVDVRANFNQGEVLPAGLTIAFAQTTAGANNPDITTIWAAIGEEQFDVIACAWNDTTTFGDLDTELERRWGPTTQNDGVAFIGFRGTFAAAAAYGAARNSKHISVMPADNALQPPHEWAGAIAGVAARYGQQDPSRPFQSLELVGIIAPAIGDRNTFDERNQLLYSGCSTYRVDAGGKVLIDRLITTYQTNSLGADDTAYLDVTTRLTLSFLRYAFRNHFALKFPRAKLSSDETLAPGPGQQIVTPSVARAECIAWFGEMLELGIVEDIESFRSNLEVEVDPTDGNRLNIVLPPDLIGQLVVTAARIAFRL